MDVQGKCILRPYDVVFLIRLYFTFCIGVFLGSPLCGMEGESRLKMRDVMIIAR